MVGVIRSVVGWLVFSAAYTVVASALLWLVGLLVFSPAVGKRALSEYPLLQKLATLLVFFSPALMFVLLAALKRSGERRRGAEPGSNCAQGGSD